MLKKILLICIAGCLVNLSYADNFIMTDRESSVVFERPSSYESFTFAIIGNRTAGPRSGLDILSRAIDDINILSPDMVMSVGDYTQGNDDSQWHLETSNFLSVIEKLEMPWFPVAGNCDVIWYGSGSPENQHEGDYEDNFGPLWYAFEHKDCWFIVLYTEEGSPDTGRKNTNSPECQTMSPKQTEFLERTLEKAKDARHVFVFLHNPRWLGGSYGNDWERIHDLLVRSGNVSACFAGNQQRLIFYGEKDGIEYHSLASLGGNLAGGIPNINNGILHEFHMVTVRGDDFELAAFPVGKIIDPKSSSLNYTLLHESKWIVSDNSSRIIKYPIVIPEFNGSGCKLKIGIEHAIDDSGDRGITYKLYSDSLILKQGFLDNKDYYWLETDVAPKQNLVFQIMDQDTSFKGDAPGNAGKIKMELVVNK